LLGKAKQINCPVLLVHLKSKGAKNTRQQLLDEIKYLIDKIAKARDLLIEGALRDRRF